jgi:GT2 family glycosyltransferase
MTTLDRPPVGVVVLNWCGERDTRECISSLQRSSYPNLRILLVDNASPDGSGERLRREFLDVDYLQTGANLGYAGGNNRGINRAIDGGSEFVMVVNNDTVVDAECITRLVTTLRADPAIGAVAPEIRYHDRPDRVWFTGGEFCRTRAIGVHRSDESIGSGSHPAGFLSGCCMMVPAKVFRAVGGFDDSFFAYLEDVDLSLRIREAGMKLVVCREARVLHRVPFPEPEPMPYQIALRDRNRRRIARRWLGPADRIRFFIHFITTRTVHALRYTIRGDRERLTAIIRGALGR